MAKLSGAVMAVGLRYAAIALQFLILSLIAHHFSRHDYGLYIFVLSAVLPLFPLLGLGASEYVVREMPRLDAQRERPLRRQLAGTTLGIMLLNALLVFGIALLLAATVTLDAQQRTTLWFAAGFFIANGVMFNCAQLLLAMDRQALGAFFYYPAINLGLMAVSVPYMLLSDTPDFAGLATATVVGASVMAAIALVLALRLGGRPRFSLAPAMVQIAIGIRLACARALYGIGLWLPTFLAGVLLSPTDAGILGTAGRLSVAVSAAMAAIRFSVRPAIVRAAQRNDMDAIAALCGRLASVNLLFAVAAMAGTLLLGRPIIALAFGPGFDAVVPVLALLLIAIAIECFGGPVDEVLKMTGAQDGALFILALGVALLAVASVALSHVGLMAMAGAQVIYSAFVFGLMLLLARRRLGIWLRPRIALRPARIASESHGHV
ncbi:lipopolysaccharide biosynthesis protein [Sphingobium aquiterrae]|uniref:lipopolysaccharide biosynthesis protein n=1 Tax=Sphingobium aquiterrae TaxID=2038656 RepID=UPI0030189BC0